MKKPDEEENEVIREAAPRTLAVWCPDWPITAAGLTHDVPAAVIAVNRVVACSAAARHDGVRRGLRRREAQARCPDLQVLERDDARDARAFEPVVACVETFTTGVEVLRPGACVFATRGPSRYFGGDAALAARVVAAIGELAPVRVGIADGVFAATLGARHGEHGAVVPPGESATFLAPLPITALGDADAELIDLLERLGIHTLGRFAEIPESSVLARFGDVGVTAHRRARGLDDRPVDGRVPPPD